MLEETSNILLGAGIASVLIYFVQNKATSVFANKRLLLIGILLIVIALLSGGFSGRNDFMRGFRDGISGK